MAAANAHPFPALHLQQAAKAFSSDRITPVSNTSRLRLIRDASLWGLNPYRVFLHESGQYPTFYRRHKVTPGHQQPRPTPARALCDSEREHVLNVLASPRFVDRAPAEVVATLLDEGQYLCSQRTMYRILAANQPVRERRNQLEHPRYTKPELVATGPNETWSWDITRLLGPTRWTYFYLYVLLDIFSRYVVGWMVAERENAALAATLIEQTCLKQGIEPQVLTLHSDRGAPMTSKCTAQLLADLGGDSLAEPPPRQR